MEALLEYLVKPLTSHPDEVQISAMEGSASVLLELRVHADDMAAVRGDAPLEHNVTPRAVGGGVPSLQRNRAQERKPGCVVHGTCPFITQASCEVAV